MHPLHHWSRYGGLQIVSLSDDYGPYDAQNFAKE